MTAAATTETGARPPRAGRRSAPTWVGTVPFLAYTGVFLLLPTGIVIWNAFRRPTGGFTFSNISALNTSAVRTLFVGSLELCVISALIGAVLGAILAYAVASGRQDGVVRRLYLAGSGVLAHSAESRWRSRSSPQSVPPAASCSMPAGFTISRGA